MRAVRANGGYILIPRNNNASHELASGKYRVEANEGNPSRCSLAVDRGNEGVMNGTVPVAFSAQTNKNLLERFIFVQYLALIAFRHSLAGAQGAAAAYRFSIADQRQRPPMENQ